MEAMVRVALLVFGALVLMAILLDGIKRNREKAAYMRRIDLDLPPQERLNVFSDDEREALMMHAMQVGAAVEPSRSEPAMVAVEEVEPVIEIEEAVEEPVVQMVEVKPEVQVKPAEPVKKAKSAIQPSLLMLSVMAKNKGVFSGKAIVESMHLMGLELDRNGIFQRFANGQPQQGVQFCVVQAVEPGTFDKFTLDRLVTPGLTLFLSLPGPRSPMHAFDEMLRAARTLASRLGGDLKNEERDNLSNHNLQEYRERVRAVESLLKETEVVE